VLIVDVGATRIGDAQGSLLYASGRLSSQYEAEGGRRKQERRRKTGGDKGAAAAGLSWRRQCLLAVAERVQSRGH
jgi:hypothetical protein